jgi:hypothetical protein
MRYVRVCRGRVEEGLVGFTASYGSDHGIVDLEDGVFGAVVAVGFFVFAFDDGEGIHDVVNVVALDAVEVEVGGVEFAAEQEAAVFVPAEGSWEWGVGSRWRGIS